LILPSPNSKKVSRGCPAKNDKPFTHNSDLTAKAAPYVVDMARPFIPFQFSKSRTAGLLAKISA
jgi:hypothetical protein